MRAEYSMPPYDERSYDRALPSYGRAFLAKVAFRGHHVSAARPFMYGGFFLPTTRTFNWGLPSRSSGWGGLQSLRYLPYYNDSVLLAVGDSSTSSVGRAIGRVQPAYRARIHTVLPSKIGGEEN